MALLGCFSVYGFVRPGKHSLYAANKNLEKQKTKSKVTPVRKIQEESGGFSSKEESPFSIEEIVLDSATLKSHAAAAINGLGQQKKNELERKFVECAEAAPANFSRYTEVRAWVMLSWLRCAREITEEKRSLQELKKSLAEFDKNQLLLTKPAAGSLLRLEVLKSRIVFIEKLIKTQGLGVAHQIEKVFQWEEFLDKNQKAKVYFIASELAQFKGDLVTALAMAQNSLLELDQKSTRDKISSLKLALNLPAEETSTAKKEEESISDAEGVFEERFKQSGKSQENLALMEDLLEYLKIYPGGRKSKWAQDKILDIYNQIFDQLSQNNLSLATLETLRSARERALQLMEGADGFRLMDWAKVLHRRLDLEAGLRLSEKSLEKFESSGASAVAVSPLFYIAGRSAQMLGNYKKAKKYFEDYVQKFSGTEEGLEVLFRLGLVHLRMGQANSAIANFEKLLTSKNIDKFELNTKYWLARAYQATNNTKALAVIDDLIARYTFSYYGLRLRMERTSGVLEWPAPLTLEKSLKGQIRLLKAQKETLNRVETLMSQGWVFEANLELQNFPSQRDPESKMVFAYKLAKMGIFPRTIRLLNELTDLSGDYKTLDIVSLGLPTIHSNVIQENATKNKLNPILVKSLIRQESAFGNRALSTSNALGLMQIIPPTAQEIASDLGLQKISIPDDMYLPELNIQMGSYYLAKVIRSFGGNVAMGLAAYNAGPQRLKLFVNPRDEVRIQMEKFSSDPLDEMWFDELPWAETSFYVKAILRNTIMYRLMDASDKKPDQRKVQFESVLWSTMASVTSSQMMQK